MVSLSVKNVPDEILALLKERARRNHRSLQGELLVILENAVQPKCLKVSELRERIAEYGIETPNEAAELIRKARDEDDR